MKLHYIQHVPFETPAGILKWASSRSVEISSTKMFESAMLPELPDLDFLVIMGGPMSVNEESKFHWMKNEKKFIENCISHNKKILGICLGAQLIADVLGAEVSSNKNKEIGWYDVEKCTDIRVTKQFPAKFKAFHWHGERFNIPDGAAKIFESEACDNQGFVYGNAVGLQFHIESDDYSIKAMVENCASDIDNSRYVQNINEIIAGKSNIPVNSKIMISFLDDLIILD
ncbi:MAG TPA: type 1 glutamine amidotransferase [Spirochaetota bacterium]|nr:type 1 glutamine amidotransferase [Spirochaetota bacterium]HQO22750.1 type 1 glutamine amidotransferase [Spirochaetota bacterium]HQQ23627.1 type 1 glutamine amidotransferase [Spirochaetota bacterium]